MKYAPNDRAEYDAAHDTRLFLRIIGILTLLVIALIFSVRYYNQQDKVSIFNPIIEHSEIKTK